MVARTVSQNRRIICVWCEHSLSLPEFSSCLCLHSLLLSYRHSKSQSNIFGATKWRATPEPSGQDVWSQIPPQKTKTYVNLFGASWWSGAGTADWTAVYQLQAFSMFASALMNNLNKETCRNLVLGWNFFMSMRKMLQETCSKHQKQGVFKSSTANLYQWRFKCSFPEPRTHWEEPEHVSSLCDFNFSKLSGGGWWELRTRTLDCSFLPSRDLQKLTWKSRTEQCGTFNLRRTSFTFLPVIVARGRRGCFHSARRWISSSETPFQRPWGRESVSLSGFGSFSLWYVSRFFN